MDKIEKDGVVFFRFASFEQTGLVAHGFSTRLGGVSQGPFESLNLGFYYKSDAESNVLENFKRFATAVGFGYENTCFSNQVHGISIYNASVKDKGARPQDVDGYVSASPGVALLTFHADCVPLFFIDPIKKVIALSHAGWRGTADGIALETVKTMELVYHCKPKDILAGIGPSIGPDAFEVDSPVAEYFMLKRPQTQQCVTQRGQKYHINLWEVNRQVLLECGILPEHIEVAGICTKSDPGLFFSHRAMGTQRGSMAAVITLK